MAHNWEDFDEVFHTKPKYSPDNKHADAALKHRNELGGTLFFDRIWNTLGLKQGSTGTCVENVVLTWQSYESVPAEIER